MLFSDILYSHNDALFHYDTKTGVSPCPKNDIKMNFNLRNLKHRICVFKSLYV